MGQVTFTFIFLKHCVNHLIMILKDTHKVCIFKKAKSTIPYPNILMSVLSCCLMLFI